VSETEPTLPELRAEIDQVDAEIQALIVRRSRCAEAVARVKMASLDASNELDATLFYRPEREAQVLREVLKRELGPVNPEGMTRLFREIMSLCLSLEQPLRVGYLGPQGTFTEAAAMKHFGQAVEGVALATISEVFREVEAGAAHYGVVPVENSSEGMVNHTLDCFTRSKLTICGEVELRIHHHFLKSATTQVGNISRVYGHEQTLAQCRQWLDAHYPRIERIAVSSNGEAARRVKGEWHSAAIAGDIAATRYELDYIANNIEDNPDNTTRFLIIGRQQLEPTGEDKTSVIVATKDRPGALYKLLEPLMEHGISMTRLETRPSNVTKWSYVFFIDFEGHQQDQNVQAALSAIEAQSMQVRRLGSYPKSVLGVV